MPFGIILLLYLISFGINHGIILYNLVLFAIIWHCCWYYFIRFGITDDITDGIVGVNIKYVERSCIRKANDPDTRVGYSLTGVSCRREYAGLDSERDSSDRRVGVAYQIVPQLLFSVLHGAHPYYTK